jgi:hypothetical protein
MGEIVGSLISGNAAKRAAQTQANAQTEAARIGADAQRFKPVGITTAFGSSNFGFGPDGDLSSAGYSLTPEMAAQRDAFLSQAQNQGIGLANQAGQAGQGLFNLGQGYLAQTPEQAGQQWLTAQQAALAPGQEQQLAGIRNNQFQQGRGGLAVGATNAGGMGASNPELQAYYNSIAQTNLGLQGQAQAEGRAQTEFGSGLLSGGLGLVSEGYNPYKTQFGLGQSVEAAGQDAFNMSSALGGRQAQAGANVGQTLQSGGNAAANSMLQANSYSPLGTAISGLGSNQDFNSAMRGMFSGFSTPTPSASPFTGQGLQMGSSQGFGTKSPYQF